MEQEYLSERKVPRQLKYLYGLGLENYEISYLLSLKRKEDISRKWRH